MKRAYSQQSSSSASPPATHAAALFLPKGGPVKKHKVNPDFNPYALPSSPPAPNLAVNAPGDYDSADDLDRDRSRSRSLAPTPAPAKGKGKAKAKKRQASQRVDPEEEDDLDVGGASGSRVGTAARQQSRRSVSTFSNQGDGPTQANAQLDALGIPPAGAEEEDENYGTDDEEFTLDQKSHLEVKEDLRVLLQHFDEAQMERYESYRRSGLGKTAVRKLVNQVLAQSVSQNVLTVVRGFSKVFVGEIVEKARSVANHSGPLTPADLREAHRLYLLDHSGAGSGTVGGKKMFCK